MSGVTEERPDSVRNASAGCRLLSKYPSPGDWDRVRCLSDHPSNGPRSQLPLAWRTPWAPVLDTRGVHRKRPLMMVTHRGVTSFVTVDSWSLCTHRTASTHVLGSARLTELCPEPLHTRWPSAGLAVSERAAILPNAAVAGAKDGRVSHTEGHRPPAISHTSAPFAPMSFPHPAAPEAERFL